MPGRDAMLFDGQPMFRSAIAAIAVPAVLRMCMVKAVHVFIPKGLGQDARRGDGGVLSVTADDAAMGEAFVFDEPVPVYEQEGGSFLQVVQRLVHGQERSAEDVDAVDLIVARPPKCERDGPLYQLSKPCALTSGKDLAIANVAVPSESAVSRKGDATCRDWSRKGPGASLIDMETRDV